MPGMFGLDDDVRLALLTAGLGTLAGRGGPMRAAGQGGLLGVQSYQNSKADKANAERERLRDEMLRLQIENQREQMEMARRAAAQQQAAQSGISSAFQGAMTPGSPGRPAGLGDVDEGMDTGMQPAVAPRAPSFDYGRFAQGVAPYDQKLALSALEKAGPKEKKVKEQRPAMWQGKPVMVILYEDGTHDIAPYEPEPDMQVVGLGDRDVAIDKRRVAPGTEFKRGVGPDTVYSGNVTMRGQNLADARAREANTTAQTGNITKSVADLRKEFNGLEEVKNFKAAAPILRSAMSAPDTPAGDLDIIYAVGKVLDPNSVVREGELNLVIKSGTPLEQYQGYVRAIAQGKGRLPPAQRAKLMAMLQGRTAQLESGYRATRSQYEKTAAAAGLPLEQIFSDIETPGAPEVGEVRKGYRFKGGDPAVKSNWEKT